MIEEAFGDDEKNSNNVAVPANEVYEEKTITVPDNKEYVIQPQEGANPDTPPVLKPAEKNKEEGEPEPLVQVSGTGILEIVGFLLEHFQQETTQPLLQTTGDSVLKLDNVTLSSN